MSAYVQDTQIFTRRTIVLFAIIAIHVFIAWVLATGLATRAIQLVAPPIQTSVVQQQKQQLKPPPPPPPQMQQQQVQVPPPVVNIQIPTESQTHAITVVRRVVKAAPAAPVATTPLQAIQDGFPPTDQYYPDASRRLGEQGTALVKLCIGTGGRVIGDPSVTRSSGSSRLDEAAIRYAKATSGHFKPATRGGVAFTECVSLPIKFQLTDSF
ncbi:MAG: energy transducer TonB [Steroidobacteraceae bacterium]